MSAIRGRVRRPDNTPTRLMQARVPGKVIDEIRAAAEVSGVSFALYVETLILRVAQENGGLPVYADLSRQRGEEQPLPAA